MFSIKKKIQYFYKGGYVIFLNRVKLLFYELFEHGHSILQTTFRKLQTQHSNSYLNLYVVQLINNSRFKTHSVNIGRRFGNCIFHDFCCHKQNENQTLYVQFFFRNLCPERHARTNVKKIIANETITKFNPKQSTRLGVPCAFNRT